MTRRDNPFRAYLTIIEGCDKACSYCVVPFTRGPERSRASASILEEVRELADAGYSEIQLLGQTVNSYRDPSPRRMSFRGTSGRRGRECREFAACASRHRIRAISARDIVDGDGLRAGTVRSRASAGAIRLDAHSARDAAHLYARRVSRKNRNDPRRAAAHQHHLGHHRGLSRARPSRISRRPLPCSTPRSTTASLRFNIRRARIRLRSTCPTRCRKKRRAAGWRCCRSGSAKFRLRATNALIGQTFEVLVDGASRARTRPMVGSHVPATAF